jgi:hypothetical protein
VLFRSSGFTQRLSFMIRGGKIVRADAVKPARLKTVDGLTFGDQEVSVVSLYASLPGGASDEPLSEESDVTLVAASEFSHGAALPRLVYEITEASGVTAIHAGWVPRGFNPHGCPIERG